MTSSDEAAKPAAETPDRDADAEAAAAGLKEQIAAVRARVRKARETLREHARGGREPRSFKP